MVSKWRNGMRRPVSRRAFIVGSLALGAGKFLGKPIQDALSYSGRHDLSLEPTITSQSWQGSDFANGVLRGTKVTDSGLTLSEPANIGDYLSQAININSGFNTVVPIWTEELDSENGRSQSGHIQIFVRSAKTLDAWQSWQLIHLNHDWTLPDDNESIGQMLVVPDMEIHEFVQFSVQIVRADSSHAPILSTLKLAIINSASGPKAEALEQVSQYSLTGYPKPPVVPRTEWCTSPDCQYSNGLHFEPVTHLIVHHTVTANGATNWPAIVRAIWAFHTYDRGWGDIGYNYLIDPDGVIYEGHLGGDDVIGTHAAGANAGSMGVALLGTFTRPDQTPSGIIPPENMQDSLVELLAWKVDQKGIDVYDSSQLPNLDWGTPHLGGHRDVYGTTVCPGDLAHDLLPEIRDQIGVLLNLPAIHMYVDELSPMFTKSIANWYEGPYQCGFDGHAWYTFATADPDQSTNWAEWRPVVPLDGWYEVDIFVPFCNTGLADATGARYEVHHAQGVDNIVVNQAVNLGLWVSLGNFEFESGSDGYVFLSDLTMSGSGSTIWFDAIRLRYSAPVVNYLTPSNDSWLLERSVTFNWNFAGTIAVTQTRLEVADNDTFTTLLYSQEWNGVQTSAQGVFESDHPDLYWRVLVTLTDGSLIPPEVWSFHIDSTPPSSQVTAVSLLPAGYYVISWSGTDSSSGIATFDIEFRAEGAANWLPLTTHTIQTSSPFTPPLSNTIYWFRSQATDHVGWVEPQHPDSGDISTNDAILLDKSVAFPIINND